MGDEGLALTRQPGKRLGSGLGLGRFDSGLRAQVARQVQFDVGEEVCHGWLQAGDGWK